MIRIAVAGAAGRMGREIITLLKGHDQAQLSAALEYESSPRLGDEVGGVLIGSDVAAALAKSDVLIDFTSPEASAGHAALAAEAGVALVIGTTGLKPGQQDEVRKAADTVPVVFAPNMSVGMNLMFKLVGMISGVLGEDYALELLEAHHDQKVDSPSGTAVKLINEIAGARGWDPDEVCKHGRKGMVGPREKQEIGVGVIRGGDIVGDHTVYFIGQGERLEFTHRAHSRKAFAPGAIRAALWAAGQKPGLYDMQDVLGLKD